MTLEMPDKCRELYPWFASVRQLLCYAETTARRGARKVWMPVGHAPWPVHLLHDQFNFAEVLRQEVKRGRSHTTRVWKVDWVAAGRKLKPKEVSPGKAAALGVDGAASLLVRDAEREKELALLQVFVPQAGRRPVTQ